MLMLDVLVTPQQETNMARPRPVFRARRSTPLGFGCAAARYARLRSASPQRCGDRGKKDNLQKVFTPPALADTTFRIDLSCRTRVTCGIVRGNPLEVMKNTFWILISFPLSLFASVSIFFFDPADAAAATLVLPNYAETNQMANNAEAMFTTVLREQTVYS